MNGDLDREQRSHRPVEAERAALLSSSEIHAIAAATQHPPQSALSRNDRAISVLHGSTRNGMIGYTVVCIALNSGNSYRLLDYM